MALVTFTSPEYRDKTVYAVSGSHTQTVLKSNGRKRKPKIFLLWLVSYSYVQIITNSHVLLYTFKWHLRTRDQ